MKKWKTWKKGFSVKCGFYLEKTLKMSKTRNDYRRFEHFTNIYVNRRPIAYVDILDQAQDQKQIHSCQKNSTSLRVYLLAKKRSDGVAISSTFTNAKKSMNFEGISDNAIQDIGFHKQNPKGIVIIRGATATGKTKLSLEIAKKIDIEIISCDSRQFFRNEYWNRQNLSKN